MLPLKQVKQYDFKENNAYDKLAVDFVNKHRDIFYLDELTKKAVEYLNSIMAKEDKLTEVQEKALKTRLYFATHYIEEKEKEIERQKTGRMLFDLTTEKAILEKAEGKKLVFWHENIMGKSKMILRVKRIRGELYLMPPRAKRRYYYSSNFWGENCEIIAN